jgi:DNA-binding IclR family transcriptional regulator
LDLVRPRVSLGDEPELAAVAVAPPFELEASDILAEVDVVAELAERGPLGRTREHFAAVTELLDGARAAVRAGQQERHYSVICNTVLIVAILSAVPRTGQPSRGRVASARRSVAILDALATGGTLGTNEIARRTGITPSTVSRQLGTLVDGELIEYVEETGQYRLGLRLVQLGNAVLSRLDVRDVARPHLEALVADVGETATLSVPGDEDAVTIDFVPSVHSVHHVTQLGRPSIAHASSAGKVMLAFSGRPLPSGPLHAFTPRTITDSAQLAREIDRVRARGYAEAIEEREPGLAAIAAPVWSSRQELVAIVALQGPTVRFGRNELRAALPLLLERTTAVSRELGWEG